MLDVRLEIGQIGYRSCVEAMLPSVVEYCAAKEQPNELEQVLTELGSDAVPVVCAVLDDMDTDAKDRLVVWMISAHEERLRDGANQALEDMLGGPSILIGYLLAQDRPGSRLTLLATHVRIDYDALLHNPLVTEGVEQLGGENAVLKSAATFALKIGAHMSPEKLERHTVTLLNSKRVKARLMAELSTGLRQAGLEIEVSDMVAESNTAILLPESLEAGRGKGSETFDNQIVHTLAARLRDRHGRQT